MTKPAKRKAIQNQLKVITPKPYPGKISVKDAPGFNLSLQNQVDQGEDLSAGQWAQPGSDYSQSNYNGNKLTPMKTPSQGSFPNLNPGALNISAFGKAPASSFYPFTPADTMPGNPDNPRPQVLNGRNPNMDLNVQGASAGPGSFVVPSKPPMDANGMYKTGPQPGNNGWIDPLNQPWKKTKVQQAVNNAVPRAAKLAGAIASLFGS